MRFAGPELVEQKSRPLMTRLVERFRNFIAWAEPDPKNSIYFFAFLGYPSTILRTAYMKQFYPEPMVPMESRDSAGVPFASLESL